MAAPHRFRRFARRATISIAAAVAALPLLALPARASDGHPLSAVSATLPKPLFLGASVDTGGGKSTESQAVSTLEGKIGRKLGAVRVFYMWDDTFPNRDAVSLRDSGHLLVMSVLARERNGTIIPWAEIAQAQPGSVIYAQIARWATSIIAFGAPVDFIFNHEPETHLNAPNGSAGDFIAAWRHVVNVFRSLGVHNASYVLTMTDYAYNVRTNDPHYAGRWYPGNAYVDDLAADSYNWYDCRPGIDNPWTSLADDDRGIIAFGRQHPAKGLINAEWASATDPRQPGRRSQWLADVATAYREPAFHQFIGLLYYDYPSLSFPGCDWPLVTSHDLDAFKALAHDSFFSAMP